MEISRKGQNDALPKFTLPNSEIYLLLFSVLYGESCRVILLPDIFTNIMWHAFPDNSIPTCKWYYMWFPQSDCYVAGKSGMRRAGRLKFPLSTQECNSIKSKYFVENPSLWGNCPCARACFISRIVFYWRTKVMSWTACWRYTRIHLTFQFWTEDRTIRTYQMAPRKGKPTMAVVPETWIACISPS